MQRRTVLTILGIAGGFGLAACGGGAGGVRASDDVLAVARDNGLGRFLRAVEAADLAATLSTPGPYTVFAPSDRAFASARLPSDPAALRGLVAYHVVPGMYDAAFLDGLDANYTTAAGRSLNVDGTAGLRVDGARVIRPDLEASNGVVHVIDRVLTPG